MQAIDRFRPFHFKQDGAAPRAALRRRTAHTLAALARMGASAVAGAAP